MKLKLNWETELQFSTTTPASHWHVTCSHASVTMCETKVNDWEGGEHSNNTFLFLGEQRWLEVYGTGSCSSGHTVSKPRILSFCCLLNTCLLVCGFRYACTCACVCKRKCTSPMPHLYRYGKGDWGLPTVDNNGFVRGDFTTKGLLPHPPPIPPSPRFLSFSIRSWEPRCLLILHDQFIKAPRGFEGSDRDH